MPFEMKIEQNVFPVLPFFLVSCVHFIRFVTNPNKNRAVFPGCFLVSWCAWGCYTKFISNVIPPLPASKPGYIAGLWGPLYCTFLFIGSRYFIGEKFSFVDFR